MKKILCVWLLCLLLMLGCALPSNTRSIGSTTINTEADVIAALDTAEPGSPTADSIYDKIHTIEEHQHSAALVYPTGAAGVTATCGTAAAWTLGSFAEIVPVSTIGDVFDVHFVNIEAVSAAAIYEIVLYATTTEIARIRFTAVGTPNNITFPSIPIQTANIAADTQIQAKVMSSTGNADTVTISIHYHIY